MTSLQAHSDFVTARLESSHTGPTQQTQNSLLPSTSRAGRVIHLLLFCTPSLLRLLLNFHLGTDRVFKGLNSKTQGNKFCAGAHRSEPPRTVLAAQECRTRAGSAVDRLTAMTATAMEVARHGLFRSGPTLAWQGHVLFVTSGGVENHAESD